MLELNTWERSYQLFYDSLIRQERDLFEIEFFVDLFDNKLRISLLTESWELPFVE